MNLLDILSTSPYYNNNELYLHDHISTYSIAKVIFRNQNYNTGQLRYFNLIIIYLEHQNKLKYI